MNGFVGLRYSIHIPFWYILVYFGIFGIFEIGIQLGRTSRSIIGATVGPRDITNYVRAAAEKMDKLREHLSITSSG